MGKVGTGPAKPGAILLRRWLDCAVNLAVAWVVCDLFSAKTVQLISKLVNKILAGMPTHWSIAVLLGLSTLVLCLVCRWWGKSSWRNLRA